MLDAGAAARRSLVRRAVLGLCIAGAVIVGALVAPFETDAPGWGCPRERIGFTVADSAGSGGSPTALEAARAWIPLLVEDGTIPAERLEAAFDTRSGPSSYDVGSGELRIGGELIARLGVSRLSDGTWGVGSVEHCMRPPGEE
jgi:hypothetical protein